MEETIGDRLKSNFTDRRDRNRLPLSTKIRKEIYTREGGKKEQDKNALETMY